MPAPIGVLPSSPNHFATPVNPQKKELSPAAQRRIDLANQIKAAGESKNFKLQSSLCIECAQLLDNGDWNNLGMLKATANMWAMAYNASPTPQAKEEATKRRQAAETLEAQLKLKALKV